MKILTDREYERRIQCEVELREKQRDQERWMGQRIEAVERHTARTLDRFEMELNKRLYRIEHALGLDRPTCDTGDELPVAKPMDTSL